MSSISTVFELPTALKTLSNITPETSWEDLVKAFSFLKRVMHRHIIVKIDNFQYRGKIIVPDQAKRQGTKGRIVALDTEGIADLKVGDRILYSQFAGYALKFADAPIARCIGYDEVLALLDEDTPEQINLEG